MELTRRDALGALAAGGVVIGGSYAVADRHLFPSEEETNMLVEVAEILYPSEVDVTEDFIETYVMERAADDEYREAMEDAITNLEQRVQETKDQAFADLSSDEQDETLKSLGLQSVESDPDGTPNQRIRYYIINELLYALYTTPTGGELVGLENPNGYPGGMESYQRGPQQ